MVNQLFSEFADLKQVEAIALGGSRAGECYDEKSDYDVYVYITSPISEETRRGILQKYCSARKQGAVSLKNTAGIWRSAISIGSSRTTAF